MKKSLFLISTFFAFLFFMCLTAHAATQLKESPEIKVIINGKINTYADVPIVINGRTLLPFREVLVSLGVPNDPEHIQWDSIERSVTVIKDDIKIYLKINNTTAAINDNPVQIDVAPMIYNNRTYIPARFISQSLNKKVVWDDASKSALIQDVSEFTKVKDLILKVNESMQTLSHVRCNINSTVTTQTTKEKITSVSNALSDIDFNQKVMHMKAQTEIMNKNKTQDSEVYLANNFMYIKSILSGKWLKAFQRKEVYNKQFVNSVTIDDTDAVCAGLVIDDQSNPNEILLKGNGYQLELFKQTISDLKISNYAFSSAYLEISINKTTNLISKVSMTVNSVISVSGSSQAINLDEKVDLSYSNYNGDFEVKLPADIEKNAVSL